MSASSGHGGPREDASCWQKPGRCPCFHSYYFSLNRASLLLYTGVQLALKPGPLPVRRAEEVTRLAPALEAGGTGVHSDWRVSWGNKVPSANTAQCLATNCFSSLIHPQLLLTRPPSGRLRASSALTGQPVILGRRECTFRKYLLAEIL